MKVYGGEFEVETKADNSPLTLADRDAHKAISGVLAGTGLPVLSEEGSHIHYHQRKDWQQYWLVDPLDGTKEFIKRNGEFTVNIALIESGRPVLGVIYVPVTGVLYYACRQTGALKTTLRNHDLPVVEELVRISARLPLEYENRDYTIVASKSHLSEETVAYIEKIREEKPGIGFVSVGSSLKLCLIAEGAADLYPRFGPTMEWDTAAGHAIVEISGGYVHDIETGLPLRYNKEKLRNPHFIAGR